MKELEKGLEALKNGRIKEAQENLELECYGRADSAAAGYLSMMYYKGILPEESETALAMARLLWAATAQERASSAHRLGTQYLSSRDPGVRAKGRQLVQTAQQQDYPYAHCVMGILLYREKDFRGAADCFRRYPQVLTDRKVLPLYADALEKTGSIAQAARTWAVLADHFQDKTAAGKACELYIQAGDPSKAEPYARQADAGLTGEQYKKLADSCRQTGGRAALSAALEYYRKALSKGEKCRYHLAGVLRRLGNDDEAYTVDLEGLENKDYRCGAGVFRYVSSRLDNAAIRAQWPDTRLDALALQVENTSNSSDLEDIRTTLGRRLAGIYYEGRGVQKSYRDSARCASWAPDDPLCRFYMGFAATMDEYPLLSEQQGLEYIQQAADQGVPEAMVEMGDRWNECGQYPKAVVCYQNAFRKGYKAAAVRIGDMYTEGKVGLILGRIPDKKTAQQWYDKGAE